MISHLRGMTTLAASGLVSPPDAGGAVAPLESLEVRDHGVDCVAATATPRARPDEAVLVERLRARDEAAFVALVERHGQSFRRLARLHVPDAVADDVVQETWIAVLHGLDRFEGRASLQTWMIRILLNIARSRGEREHRQVPLSAFVDAAEPSEGSVDRHRFQSAGDRFPGGWVSFPERWDEQPEQRFLSTEGVGIALRTIASLPPAQREVVSLRDVEGWSSEEVSDTLGITPGNQRVLLHRGRSRVRAALEAAIAAAATTGGVGA